MESLLQEYVPGGAAGAAVLASALVAGTYYIATRPRPDPPMFPLHDQSALIPGPDLARRSKFAPEGQLLTHLYDDCRTIHDAFKRGARESNNGRCLGWREGKGQPYQWINYNDALTRAKNLGAGLLHLGLPRGSYIGIYSANCPEWVICEQGLYCHSMVIVPLYDTLGAEATAFIISQAEMSTVVVEDERKMNLLLDQAPPCLKRLIHMRDVGEATVARANKLGISLLNFAACESLGAANPADPTPPTPEDVSTICYTSGTTGNPKGVILTHGNIIACVSAVLLQLGDQKPRSTDTMISFLPLAHMLERCCQVGLYTAGGCVGFFTGDIRDLMEDFKALEPTVSPAVPRFLNRIHDKVMGQVNGSLVKRGLMAMALRAKGREISKGIARNNSLWDAVVFKKVQESMGGKLRLLVVGSAPLSSPVLTFIRCALGCVVVEGYGQTECVAPATLTIQGDARPEHVGPPLACCAIKLIDVPEMEYFAAAGQGEVCIRGNNVFKGYFKDPERTSEAMDSEGWLLTGDIGTWDDNGTLKIIDRKKHIFKLSQGEYISPEKVENAYGSSSLVSQVFIHGESLKSSVVGVIVPDPEAAKAYANSHGLTANLAGLCRDNSFKSAVLADLLKVGKSAGLKGFEQVKDIHLDHSPFSVQNGLLTPTLKTKRPQLKLFYKQQIDTMYSNID